MHSQESHLIMKLIIAGAGPGAPELVSLSAVEKARCSDLIIVPRSEAGVSGEAENIILRYIACDDIHGGGRGEVSTFAHVTHPDAPGADGTTTPPAHDTITRPDTEDAREDATPSAHKGHTPKLAHLVFPMTHDQTRRDNLILSQLEDLRHLWQNSHTIFFPVLGDSMLFSTGAYLARVWRKLCPSLETEFIPGISAHSLAASCAKRFLAMSDEILTIIPGTASPSRVRASLLASDTCAIYKPSALKELHELVKDTGPYSKIIRADYAGMAGREVITEGLEALVNVNNYLSIILLWR